MDFRFESECRTAYSGVFTILEDDAPQGRIDIHYAGATIHCTLGIDPSRELYAGDRPVPISDMGQPVRELFA